jgi:DNA-binding FadR family transcriptional regulator
MGSTIAVYLGIADKIRHEILSKELSAHTRLPSEPEGLRESLLPLRPDRGMIGQT